MRRLLALLTAVAVLVPAVPVHADGDPASDTLLITNAHYPYKPNLVSRPLKNALDKMLVAAKKQKFDLRVAIIASKTDLGSVPQLFTEPQQYADLLTREITFNNKPRVLVVLPSGIGGNNLGDNAANALRNIAPDGTDGDSLTRTAISAVAALTKANGTPVPAPQIEAAPKRDQDEGTSPLLTFGLPVLLVALVAGVAAVRSRRLDEDDEDDDDGVEVTRIPADGE